MTFDPMNIPLDPIRHLDTWDGLQNCQIGSEYGNSTTLAMVRMGWVDSDGDTGLKLTSEASGESEDVSYAAITIDDATEWIFSVKPIDAFPLAPGIWSWSIEVTDSEGRRRTLIGGTKEVQADATEWQ